MKIKTTLAVFGAILALSACTQVSTTPTTSPAEVIKTGEAVVDGAAAGAAEPTTTVEDKPLVLPTAVPTTTEAPKPLVLPTTPPTTISEPTITEHPDSQSDGVLSESEWEISKRVLADNGVSALGVDRDTAQSLGEAICGLASVSSTSDEYVLAVLTTGNGAGFTDDEAISWAAVTTAQMCRDELTRLGF